MDNVNIELIRGHMDTIILRTLLSGAKYGLEILNEIRDSSQELYTLKQPTLYNSLKRLEKLGYIMSTPGNSSNGAKRVYYELSDSGKDFVVEDQRQWEFSRTIIDKLVSDRVFDPTINDKPFDPSEFRPSTRRVGKGDEASDANKTYTQVVNTAPLAAANIASIASSDDLQPIVVAKSASASSLDNTKFQFSAELDKVNVSNLPKADMPTAIEALYDEKWQKPVVDYGYTATPNVKKPAPPVDLLSFDSVVVGNKAFNDVDKKAAAALLYSDDTPIAAIAPASHDKLMHYDLGTGNKEKRPIDPLAVKNFYNMTSESVNSATPANAPNLAASTAPKESGKFSFDIWDGKQKPVQVTESPEAKIQRELKAKKIDEVTDNNRNKDEVNYISAFDNIFNSKKSVAAVDEKTTDKVKNKPNDLYSYSENPSPTPTPKPAQKQAIADESHDDVTFAKLRHKLGSEGITLKSYVKSNTSTYYVNKYYYFSTLLRDWSLVVYAMFALFCVFIFFPSKPAINGSLGVFLGFVLGGAILPIAATIYWKVNPTNRRPTTFNLAHTMITGMIAMLAMLMCILLIGFLGVKASIADFKSMLAPIILPLISLLLIPASITIYALMYNTKKYHIR